MQRLFSLLLLGALISANSALACEKHLRGHQNSSDSSSEASQR